MQHIPANYVWWSPIAILLLLLPVQVWSHKMMWVPTSVSVTAGDDVELWCKFQKSPYVNHDVSWFRYKRCENGSTCINVKEKMNYTDRMKIEMTTQSLIIKHTELNDKALYMCTVTANNKTYRSCGTYLRVRESDPYFFLNFGEATKNRLITAEGVLLLLCAVIPGTFLLYKKRWENLKTLNMKNPEGENLYEGLNLDECSMYEDISRGLQATYEDVGMMRASDIQLEKP
ncbi:B-cell antigen receptor complex-associated protein alpha chain [Pelobates fuscus]|uniref:B-cell antigen receptor complex-associated protein alpha chain n=1 Tax=Pelobates fuscus TaxID=191477 RepID=UPI002FE4A75A